MTFSMRALVLRPDGITGVVQRPLPRVSPGQFLIRVESAGVCGSDLQKLAPNSALPTDLLGHEVVGWVVDDDSRDGGRPVAVVPFVGCGGCAWCVAGSVVHCSAAQHLGRHVPGGFAQFVAVDKRAVRSLPEAIDPGLGVLADSVASVLHGLRSVPHGVHANRRMAVLGDGTLGLIAAILAPHFGYERCVVHGRHTSRAELVRALGAVPAEESEASVGSYDLAVEAVGRAQSETMQRALELARPRGSILLLGAYQPDFVNCVGLRALGYKELRVVGSNAYAVGCVSDEFDLALEAIERDRALFALLLTHRVALADAPALLERMRAGDRATIVKAVIDPWAG